MDLTQEFRLSPIERLPVELVLEILEAVPDPASLRAVVLSCPLFYNLFSKQESNITEQVLLNQIDIDVLPEAIAAVESSYIRRDRIRYPRSYVFSDFLTDNIRLRPSVARYWALSKALRLGPLHVVVDSLAMKFAMTALNQPPLNQSKHIPTRLEICRIERAFYWFEIYRNIFPLWWRHGTYEPSEFGVEQPQVFLAHFAPWENEQLGCVYDFLCRMILPGFNEIAEHDIKWGKKKVDYCGGIDSHHFQNVLTLGLQELHQIAGADSYEERHQLLKDNGAPCYHSNFLPQGLRNPYRVKYFSRLVDLTPEEKALGIKNPHFPDVDSGPADIWRWAHEGEDLACSVYEEKRSGLRQWGYVMWDRCRLDSVGIFAKPWEAEEVDEDANGKMIEAAKKRRIMEKTWERREDIYEKGGRGWWSREDMSKVKWV